MLRPKKLLCLIAACIKKIHVVSSSGEICAGLKLTALAISLSGAPCPTCPSNLSFAEFDPLQILTTGFAERLHGLPAWKTKTQQ
jgi:hypothetical protein